MADILVLLVLLLTVGAAAAYIIREKKKGVKCIGCPAAASCAHNCSGCSGGCHADTELKKTEQA